MGLRNTHTRSVFVALVGIVSGACLEPRSKTCGELNCPAGLVCAPDGARCATPGQLSACSERQEGDGCALSGVLSAQCVSQVCTAVLCGDGILMIGEVCDDGNTQACDGCSADCRTIEGCGNGLVECLEQCDDGASNANTPNADCRSDCRRQRCGDGVVDDRSGEDCDGAPPTEQSCLSLGFYKGTLGCSVACRADVAMCRGSCGDGQVEGAEFCDGLPPLQSCLESGYDMGNLYCNSLCTPSFTGCERLGFIPMSTNGISPSIFVMWKAGPQEIFAAGFGGEITHWDGKTWSVMESVAIDNIYGLSGSGPNDVYAVGRQGQILHYNGTTWSAQNSGTEAQLNAAWKSAQGEVFVVGRGGTILHSGGDGVWTAQDSTTTGRLYSVWGSSPSDVFAAGNGTIYHYDGRAWSLMTTIPQEVVDNELILYSVWGTGPDNVFVVGEAGAIVHYNGTVWTMMNSGTSIFLDVVDGRSPTDVYVSGDQGLVLHYDGLSWSQIPTASTQDLLALTVLPDQIIVGGGSTVKQFAMGLPTVSSSQTGMTGQVTSIWSSSESNVFASSASGEVFRFNGHTWVDTNTGLGEVNLWGLWGAAANDIFAVGGEGNILRFNGNGWAPMESHVTAELNWVWGAAANDVYAVGTDGVLLHFEGTVWTTVETGVTLTFYAVWGSGPNDVYAVGEAGAVFHYNGSGWSAVDTGFDFDYWGVWGTSAHDVFFFANADGVVHFDGSRFIRASVALRQPINYGYGTSSSDIFAVEYNGQTVYHHNGIDWAPIRVPVSAPASIWVTKDKAYIGAQLGQIIEIDKHCASQEKSCSDHWDNDCDGFINCADSDCDAAPDCNNGGVCQTLNSLSCGTSNSGSTLNGSPLLDRYACASRHEDGRERVYRFVAPKTGEVTIELSTQVAELDVIVVGARANGSCDPLGACLAASGAQSGSRKVTFAATAGQNYYVIVDAAENGAGLFELQVSCL